MIPTAFGKANSPKVISGFAALPHRSLFSEHEWQRFAVLQLPVGCPAMSLSVLNVARLSCFPECVLR